MKFDWKKFFTWLGHVVLTAASGYIVVKYPQLAPVLAPVLTGIAGMSPSPVVVSQAPETTTTVTTVPKAPEVPK